MYWQGLFGFRCGYALCLSFPLSFLYRSSSFPSRFDTWCLAQRLVFCGAFLNEVGPFCACVEPFGEGSYRLATYTFQVGCRLVVDLVFLEESA